VGEVENGRGCFEGKALGPELREQGIAEVDVIELNALEYATHADRCERRFERDHVQAMTMVGVTPDWPVEQVSRSLFNGPDPTVTDVRDERRVIDEPKDELGVIGGEMTED